MRMANLRMPTTRMTVTKVFLMAMKWAHRAKTATTASSTSKSIREEAKTTTRGVLTSVAAVKATFRIQLCTRISSKNTMARLPKAQTMRSITREEEEVARERFAPTTTLASLST